MFRAPFVVDGRGIPVDVKCGFARYPDNGNDANALVHNAEAALRVAKSTGEKYLPHRLELSSAVVSRMTMEHRLRAAVEHEEFEIHYQTKIDVRSREIRGLEALVRWRDPEAGLVMPGAFLPLMEASGLIVPLGDWILRQAASDLRRWQGAGHTAIRVAVNISPVQLRRRAFADHLLDLVGEWRNENIGIDIEITEGVLIDDVSSAVSQLRALRRCGVRVAIDDFGTGYSSLSRLAELPVDMLKIDRSFVSGLTSTGTRPDGGRNHHRARQGLRHDHRGRRSGDAGAVRDAGAPGLRPVAGLSAQPPAGRRRCRTPVEERGCLVPEGPAAEPRRQRRIALRG